MDTGFWVVAAAVSITAVLIVCLRLAVPFPTSPAAEEGVYGSIPSE